MNSFDTINPATGLPISQYAYMTIDEVNLKLQLAHDAFLSWRLVSFSERSRLLMNAAELLEERKDEFARLMAVEMGKPISEGVLEINKCAWVCRHYATQAESYLEPQVIPTETMSCKVHYRPLGVVLAIMPWNYPFWQVFRFLAPALMAGNGALLKHAPNSVGCGQAIKSLVDEVGFPEHIFEHLIIDNDVAAQVISNPLVCGVTLTGSERAGSSVAQTAGKSIKKVVLELGGNDPYVILSDADMEMAAKAIVASRLSNAGQVCIAAKRVIVVKDRVDELTSAIRQEMERFSMGDPLDATCNMGPLARHDLRESLHTQVLESVKKGAKLIVGGTMPDGAGFYYPPTLLIGVVPGMPAFDEELFGPVISITSANSEEDAIDLANDSKYGLGAAVFTQDIAKGERIAVEEIECGACFVNSFVASDPRLPFGGIKLSGIGRELSKEGIISFMNAKTVAIKS